MTNNLFVAGVTDKPFVAVMDQRNGYVMLAPSKEIQHYNALPESLFTAARAWAESLESLDARRVYWITLSEQNPHLHIHLFPRWAEDTLQGIPLFETRNQPGQPAWTQPVREACQAWAERWDIELLS